MDQFQLLIKPAGPDCNLNCSYCFYSKKSALFPSTKVHRMDDKIVDAMVSQILSQRFPVSVFSWQGGEPTIAGIEFFRKVVAAQMKYGTKGQVVANSFQTNGYLLNDQWCSFFAEYKFFVGLSIDGPGELHDYHRKNFVGEGSWSNAYRATGMLEKHKVEYNILSVISRAGQDKGKETLQWFIGNGFKYLQFIPCVEVGDTSDVTDYSVTPKGYGQFLCDIFDVWHENLDKNVSIRDFDSILEKIVLGRPSMCVYSVECGGYMVVEHDGSVYPCDFFVNPGDALGNVLTSNLADMYESKKYREFNKRKAILPQCCVSCEYVNYCNNGCQKDRVGKNLPKGTQTYLCAGYKKFFGYALPRLKVVAEGIKTNMENKK